MKDDKISIDGGIPYTLKDCPPRMITIVNEEGKQLTLNFGSDKLTLSGDLSYDEAAKKFIDAIASFFYDTFVERQKVREVIEKCKRKKGFCPDECVGDIDNESLIKELRL